MHEPAAVLRPPERIENRPDAIQAQFRGLDLVAERV
jgi:hypothetical protein